MTTEEEEAIHYFQGRDCFGHTSLAMTIKTKEHGTTSSKIRRHAHLPYADTCGTLTHTACGRTHYRPGCAQCNDRWGTGIRNGRYCYLHRPTRFDHQRLCNGDDCRTPGSTNGGHNSTWWSDNSRMPQCVNWRVKMSHTSFTHLQLPLPYV